MWEKLLAATEVKTVQLSQAWQQEKFNTGVDNMNAWIDESEVILKSLNYGETLEEVEQLIKEHTLLEADARTHRDILDIIKTAAQQFAECNHFNLKVIQTKKVNRLLLSFLFFVCFFFWLFFQHFQLTFETHLMMR